MLVHIEHLQKCYHKKNVLDIESLDIEKGKIYGFVGENGAGKTTLFRLITGLSIPTAGILERDFDLQKMGIMIENPIMELGMTATENMEWMKRVFHSFDCENIQELLKLVKLDQAGKKSVKQFSLGMKQRLGIAMSLMTKPEIIMLDEPMNGLDPEGMVDFRTVLQEINRRGVTILISSHLLEELYKLATDFVFIKNGKVVHTTSQQEMEGKVTSVFCMKTSDDQRATECLEQKFSTKVKAGHSEMEFRFPKEKILTLSKQLADEGIYIAELYEKGFDIEKYYMEIMTK